VNGLRRLPAIVTERLMHAPQRINIRCAGLRAHHLAVAVRILMQCQQVTLRWTNAPPSQHSTSRPDGMELNQMPSPLRSPDPHGANSLSKALASFKSRVSKPSVNQS